MSDHNSDSRESIGETVSKESGTQSKENEEGKEKIIDDKNRSDIGQKEPEIRTSPNNTSIPCEENSSLTPKAVDDQEEDDGLKLSVDSTFNPIDISETSPKYDGAQPIESGIEDTNGDSHTTIPSPFQDSLVNVPRLGHSPTVMSPEELDDDQGSRESPATLEDHQEGDDDGDMSGDVNRDMPGDVNRDMSGDGNRDMSGDVNRDMSEDVNRDMSEDVNRNMSEDGNRDMSEDGNRDMSEDVNRNMSEDGNRDMPEDVNRDMSGDVNRNMSGDTKEPKDVGDIPADVPLDPTVIGEIADHTQHSRHSDGNQKTSDSCESNDDPQETKDSCEEAVAQVEMKDNSEVADDSNQEKEFFDAASKIYSPKDDMNLTGSLSVNDENEDQTTCNSFLGNSLNSSLSENTALSSSDSFNTSVKDIIEVEPDKEVTPDDANKVDADSAPPAETKNCDDGIEPSVPFTSQIPIEYEEPEFVWDEYLEETGATPAPPTSFRHVECSLQSGFEKGMKVEVAKKDEEGSYWIASIVMPCGQLLRLRWDGIGNNSSADFWCDISSSDIHSLGWCKDNDKILSPPEVLGETISDPQEALTKILAAAKSVPSYLLDGTTGSAPIENIKEGMRLEVQDELNPRAIWIARIMENVGGRLLLRLDGTDKAANDFWLFYTSHRLHPIGWVKENGFQYSHPSCLKDEGKPDDELDKIIDVALKEASGFSLPPDIFKDQDEVFEHNFKEGQKVEALHPKACAQFSPATISKVFDINYFLVQIDDCSPEGERETVEMYCHGGSQSVFPMHWCMYKGQRLTPPRGWPKRDFDWQEYLAQTEAEPAPESAFNNQMVFDTEITKGMKLEAVNPAQPGQICAATVTRVQDNLLWLHLDSAPKMAANHVVDSQSHDIFPVGWCESNNYPLKPPRQSYKKKIPAVQPDIKLSTEAAKNPTYSQLKQGGGGSWCPKIYFNHRCFSGPFLSKGRIAELPKCVGPGPVILVMKEVLSMLINVAYKSSRVLRELQLEGPPNSSMHQQILKAKYKGKSYQAMVEICKSSDQIEEFCRQVCIKLECCPNLFSPMFISSYCPENCHQLTKTKYTYYYGKTKKKRKIGRPPGGHSNLEHGPKKPGKRKKKKKISLGIRKKHNSGDSNDTQCDQVEEMDMCDGDSNSTGSLERGGGGGDDPDFRPAAGDEWIHSRGSKRKYQRHLPPPSEIKTRGAKLPKYSFERKTHQKVLLTSPRMQSPMPKSPKHKSAFKPVKPEPMLLLDSNPLYWNVEKVVEFIKTTDCVNLARIFKDQEIDGQALLLLTLPTVQEYMELKLGPAIKLCHHIERVKIAFFEQFSD